MALMEAFCSLNIISFEYVLISCNEARICCILQGGPTELQSRAVLLFHGDYGGKKLAFAHLLG